MGYIVFPKLLDAVWYGVPQHRSRLFLLGIREDLGYTAEDFGSLASACVKRSAAASSRPAS